MGKTSYQRPFFKEIENWKRNEIDVTYMELTLLVKFNEKWNKSVQTRESVIIPFISMYKTCFQNIPCYYSSFNNIKEIPSMWIWYYSIPNLRLTSVHVYRISKDLFSFCFNIVLGLRSLRNKNSYSQMCLIPFLYVHFIYNNIPHIPQMSRIFSICVAVVRSFAFGI